MTTVFTLPILLEKREHRFKDYHQIRSIDGRQNTRIDRGLHRVIMMTEALRHRVAHTRVLGLYSIYYSDLPRAANSKRVHARTYAIDVTKRSGHNTSACYWDVTAMSSRGVCVTAASASDEKQCSCARSAQTNPLVRRVGRRRSATYFMIEPHSNEVIGWGTLWRFRSVSR